MSVAAFYVLAALTVAAALGVVILRNPVHCAMSLVAALFLIAISFMSLQAHLVAALQIIVYAGAVMVLFLFVIMLLDLKEEQRRKANKFGWVTGIISVGAILAIFLRAIFENGGRGGLKPPALEGATHSLGKMLFNDYLLPFEILSVLLLVAMVGVILLSKKDLK